jgi:hypothetical protein
MSQWIILKGFIEEITLGLKGKRLCLAKRHIRQVLLDWTKKFENFLAMKLKWGGDICRKQLYHRSMDGMVRLQARSVCGWGIVGHEFLRR